MKSSVKRQRRMKGKGERATDIVINLMLVTVAFLAIFPLWYVVVASVSNPSAIATGKVTIFPVGFNLEGYVKLFQTKKIWIGYRNSIIYTLAGACLDLLVQFPCGFALTRPNLPFRRGINLFFILTMYFSGGMIPSYILNVKLGLVDNPLVMIIPGCVSVYNLILIKNYYSANIPETLVDAARIDGASYTQFFTRIAMPLSTPIAAIIALFSIGAHWNTYLTGQMYLYSPKYQTLQQIIVQITAKLDASLTEGSTVNAEILAKQILEKQLLKYSVVIVSALPMILLYPFIQKFFIKGIMVGAVKG